MASIFDFLNGAIGNRNAGNAISKGTGEAIGRLDPYAQQGGQATSLIGNLLGLNGGTAGGEALSQFRDSTGYRDTLNAAQGGAATNAAAKGLLGSSGTGKVFQNNATQLAQGSFGDFLQKLMGQQQMGQAAATNQANIGFQGTQAKAENKSKAGIFGSLFG